MGKPTSLPDERCSPRIAEKPGLVAPSAGLPAPGAMVRNVAGASCDLHLLLPNRVAVLLYWGSAGKSRVSYFLRHVLFAGFIRQQPAASHGGLPG